MSADDYASISAMLATQLAQKESDCEKAEEALALEVESHGRTKAELASAQATISSAMDRIASAEKMCESMSDAMKSTMSEAMRIASHKDKPADLPPPPSYTLKVESTNESGRIRTISIVPSGETK